jgi:hypothetical protein
MTLHSKTIWIKKKGTGAIPKEGTHVYWVAKLQGAVESRVTLGLRR